jgi:hypothetical protein
MGLSIKRVETERKARAVAERMGVGVTEAIDRALDDKWRELTGGERQEARRREIEAWLREVDARPRSDHRTLKEIEAEMYDDWGNPI